MSPSSSTKSRFKLFVILAALGAASFGAPFLAQAKKSKAAKKGPASTADCKTDKDCVAVPDECCPCSEGGKQHAIPKKDKESYEKDRKKRCADAACTESISNDPSCSQKPFCAAGICELTDEAAPPADAAPSGL